MAQHDFTPAWLNFPTASSSSKVNDKPFESPAECFSHRDVSRRRRHNSSDGSESAGTGGGYSRNERNGWRARNGSEGSSSRASMHQLGPSLGPPPGPTPGPPLGSKSKVIGNVLQGHRDRRKKFEAEDFPSLNPDAERKTNRNNSVTTGVWEHPPNPQPGISRMTVIKRMAREEPSSAQSSTATPQQRNASSHNGAGLSVYSVPVLKPVGLPAKVSRSSSLSPVDKGSPPRLMMRMTRMRSDRKSHFLKALRQDIVDEEDHHHHCKDDDGFHMQNSIITCGDENQNRYERSVVSRENSNTATLLRSFTFPQQEVLSSSLEAEHRLLKEMGWQEESEDDDTCAPLTEDEMREFQAISEQLQKNGLRRNGLLKDSPPADSMAVWRTTSLAAAPVVETETSSSDTSDDDA